MLLRVHLGYDDLLVDMFEDNVDALEDKSLIEESLMEKVYPLKCCDVNEVISEFLVSTPSSRILFL